MKLSDAIALGQGTVGKWEQGNIRHCALGMACNAIGMEVWLDRDGDYEAIREHWPWTKEEVEHPFRDGRAIEALELIYTLFDDHVMTGQMTFERFLDHVRSIEPAEPAPAAAEQQATAEDATAFSTTEPLLQRVATASGNRGAE